MYDVVVKLLNEIKSMYVYSLDCVGVKGDEFFRIDSGVRDVCIMIPFLLNTYMDTVIIEMKMGMRRIGKK